MLALIVLAPMALGAGLACVTNPCAIVVTASKNPLSSRRNAKSRLFQVYDSDCIRYPVRLTKMWE